MAAAIKWIIRLGLTVNEGLELDRSSGLALSTQQMLARIMLEMKASAVEFTVDFAFDSSFLRLSSSFAIVGST